MSQNRNLQAFSLGPIVDGAQKCVVFYHLHKCGGVSFRDLFGHLDGVTVRHIDDFRLWRKPSLLPRLETSWLALLGHQTWGIHGALPETMPICYVTLLRHPEARFLSHLRYTQQKQGLDFSLSKKALQQGGHNYLVKCLGNGDLKRAKQRLRDRYFFFGILEHYEDTLRVLRELLGLPFSSCSTLNATLGSRGRDTIDNEFHEMFYRLNALDFELYEWASALFHERVEQVRKHFGSRFNRPMLTVEEAQPALASNALGATQLYRDGRIQEAIERLEKNLYQPSPDAGHCEMQNLKHDFQRLASWNEQAGQYDEAISWMEKAYHIDGKLVVDLAKLYVHVDKGEAIRLLENEIVRNEQVKVSEEDASIVRFTQHVRKVLRDVV